MKLRLLTLCCLFYLIAPSLYAQAPLEFVENQGQWGDWLKYKAVTVAGDVCLEKDGIRYVLSDPENTYKMDQYHHAQKKVKPTIKFHVYKVSFEGANPEPEIVGGKPLSVYYNYFLGDDQKRWKSGIHPDREVDYKQLYKGVDMHMFSSRSNIEYEFIVAPGADAEQIKLKFTGQEGLKIKNDALIITTSVGEMSETKPYAYQYINDNKVEVACRYRLKGDKVTFDFPDGYDHNQRLIIDPIVLLCTMTGATADNWGFTATFDDAGNFYAGGLVNNLAYGGTFPISPGAFQTTFGGGVTYVDPGTGQLWGYAADISIIKFDPTLQNRIYGTYLGGAGNDHAHSMIVDPAGNLALAGRTRSTNYPVTTGAYQTVNRGGWDLIITKFNAGGTALIGSTYLGGTDEDGVNFDSTEYIYGELKYNYGDESRSEIQIDNAGNLYMTSCTNSTNFPVTPTAISSTLTGLQDGVVVKLDPNLSTLLWSTYLSGNGSDAGYVLAFNANQSSIYVAGGTNSTNFPSTAGTLHAAYQGGIADGFVLRFRNTAPYNLERGSFVGTANYDQVFGIQVTSNNDVYVMGQSLGGAFPVTAGTYSNPGSNQFVMKMDADLNTNLISTVYGSGISPATNISPVAFLVDTCDNVYVSGWGGNLGFPGIASGLCTGMPVTADAHQPTTDGMDFYFIVLGSNMSSLRYATYYGRNTSGTPGFGEHVDGGTSRFSKQGIIYQAICANCGGAASPPFPTTPGVWAPIDGSTQNCNQAALKIAFNIGPVEADICTVAPDDGCAPLTVAFNNCSNNSLSFVWNFGDGSATTTAYAPSHTFTAGGVYTVTLSAANSNACFRTEDTAYLVIVVDTNKITPGFTYTILDSCGPYAVQFTNTSVDLGGIPTYQWWFGDGTSFAGATPGLHIYPDTGNYTVMLVMTDTGACNSPDTVIQIVPIHSFRVSGQFLMPDSICLYTGIIPSRGPVNADNVMWITNPGNDTSFVQMPTMIYTTVGTYTITLIAINPDACNLIDSSVRTIKVLPVPTAAFIYSPITPEPNVPSAFTNQSINATRYLWDFGDNSTSVETNPTHQYNRTGGYTVCLNAYNSSNCPSKLCRTVNAEVLPLVGLPTGFSPNGDGSNDILYVRGAAISKLDLKIFNRWGQLVFQTKSQQVGWDGTFNGEPQPVESYAYVLEVWFIDETHKQLQGNVTLLR